MLSAYKSNCALCVNFQIKKWSVMNSYEFHLWLITEQGFTKFIQTQTELLINDFHNNHNKINQIDNFFNSILFGEGRFVFMFLK